MSQRDINPRLRLKTTNTGFSLNLTHGQIDLLVTLHHHTLAGSYPGFGTLRSDQIDPLCVLTFMGLVEEEGFPGPLTVAGELVAALLSESGLYGDVLERQAICGGDDR